MLLLCCELLSFLYLWTIKSIEIKFEPFAGYVVNCFHFCIFELSKALNKLIKPLKVCCELLSFLYLWTIKSIVCECGHFLIRVVNCFHFCIFELSKAFINDTYRSFILLWIAFIFVSLNYQKHSAILLIRHTISCELLSFLYLWTIKSICKRMM